MNTPHGMPTEVVILHSVTATNPTPDEADTLVQARAISDALSALPCSVLELAVGLDMTVLCELQKQPNTLVFNLVESLEGRGALLHLPIAVLDNLNVAYTGSNPMSLAITTDKPLSKQLLRAAGIATPDWWDIVTPPETQQVIVKPSREDGSCGITAASVMPGTAAASLIVSRPADAPDALFAEAYIDGREFNVSLLATAAEPEILPIAEIRFIDFPQDRPKILDYEAKWSEDSAAYRGTVRHTLSPCEEQELTSQLSLIAQQVWTLFDLRDYARVDFRVDAQGRPWVVDINANPCLAPDAGFAAAAAAAGLSFSEVVLRIVTAAQQRQRSIN